MCICPIGRARGWEWHLPDARTASARPRSYGGRCPVEILCRRFGPPPRVAVGNSFEVCVLSALRDGIDYSLSLGMAMA